MSEKLTNSYLICFFTVVSIVLAITSSNDWSIVLVNLFFLLTMILIALKALQRREKVFLVKFFDLFIILIAFHVSFGLLLYFNVLPHLRNLFLIVNCIIKTIIYVWGWISTVVPLIRREKVTGKTIALAITSYLFIGIICSFFYFIYFEIYPHSFHLEILRDYQFKSWNLAMYFSLTTLTTVGYGDILPVDRWVMTLCTFEAIVGLIYMTVIVARLVSSYSTFEQ